MSESQTEWFKQETALSNKIQCYRIGPELARVKTPAPDNVAPQLLSHPGRVVRTGCRL